jgi:hypothetical protein
MSTNAEDILKALCADSKAAFNRRNGLPTNASFEVIIRKDDNSDVLKALCAESKAAFNRRNGLPANASFEVFIRS